MAIHKTQKAKPKPRSPFLFFFVALAVIAFLFLFSSLISTIGVSSSFPSSNSIREIFRFKNLNQKQRRNRHVFSTNDKFLYWGNRIDCPGKHCESCEGLGHQESSLRCALEEAMFLQRVFVMPSRMCINPIHNKKGILHHSTNASSEERWETNSCAMDSLYDMDLISDTVPVILDNSKLWYQVQSTGMKLGSRVVAHVDQVSRIELRDDSRYSNLLIINRTASPLSWFMECKDRNNRSAILLPYKFLPSMAAENLRDASEKIKELLGDYDAIHVRRGDKIKTRKDRFGVDRSLHPHLDRDTRPEFMLKRIAKWVPPGRTLFIASNERMPGFFSPLSARYKLAYSSNYSHILGPVVKNNYQLFMIERLIMAGAKTFIRTFKEDNTDLSLTDDPKKNTKVWQKPIYTDDEESS
ncbi:uncharacterized protein LOC111439414 isoform X1 [Cucurbita moschata]|uniref:Uncharacterized protein LOC111439414 isoform X1 n=1 Tax=Cucurbita moschata TaxID=3662 RepID=A0A6J1EY95_CUCMO|nr:uncharacterized protein LOC111439414 isoform X1 [Cucurbita moschata]